MNKKTKLFTLIGPPEAGKMALARALTQALGDKIELMPRLTDKPSGATAEPSGTVRHVTPPTLRRHLQDGRLILTREGSHRSGFDRNRLDRLLLKKNVILVTTEDGVRELQNQLGDDGLPRYNLVVIRVVPQRKNDSDSEPASGVKADFEILAGVGPDPTGWAVHELSRHFVRILT
jgi:hypothetical protein